MVRPNPAVTGFQYVISMQAWRSLSLAR